MDIGDRVKVIEQDIVGTIVRYDCGNKVVIKEENCEWAEEDEEGVLIFHKSDLKVIERII